MGFRALKNIFAAAAIALGVCAPADATQNGQPLSAGFNAAAGFLPPARGLFNTDETRFDLDNTLPQWKRALARIESERSLYRACAGNKPACPSPGMRAWQQEIANAAGKPPLEQLRMINSFINEWPYITNADNYNRSDYWASPVEFFLRSGDCEDYAIAKYVSLRQLGFSAEQLRLVVVDHTERVEAHAVLAVYLDDGIYILDNLNEDVLKQDRVDIYIPYYSVNETARWAHTPH